MLTIILEDRLIHQGLFPGPGTIQADGTSNKHPKSEFWWMVAARLFTDDTAYGSDFEKLTKTPKGKTQWSQKVKNRLQQFRVYPP
jgi:G:T/U-mismatch repair DNA glycosylase